MTHLLCLRGEEEMCFFGDITGESGFRATWHFEHRYEVPGFTVLQPLHFQSATTPWARPGDTGLITFIQWWESSYRWERQTRRLQLGQTIDPPSVSFLSQPATGQLGVSTCGEHPLFWWRDKTVAGFSFDERLIMQWHFGHIITFRSFVETEQTWASGVRCARQNDLSHLSHLKGRKSRCLHSSKWHMAPRSENWAINNWSLHRELCKKIAEDRK